jgi:hypothetical protein
MIAQNIPGLTHLVFLEKTPSPKMFLKLNFGGFFPIFRPGVRQCQDDVQSVLE